MNRRDFNSINKSLKEIVKNSKTPFYKKLDFYILLILSILPIVIAIKSLNQDRVLSEQSQKIEDFGELLELSKSQNKKLDSTLTVMASQLNVLTNQLKLNEEQNKYFTQQLKIADKSNEFKFRLASYNIRNLIFMNKNPGNFRDWTEEMKFNFLTTAHTIIANELSNPFLLKNQELTNLWNETEGKILNYISASDFERKIKGEKSEENILTTFFNCYKKISDLFQITSSYLAAITYLNKDWKYLNWGYFGLDTSITKQERLKHITPKK